MLDTLVKPILRKDNFSFGSSGLRYGLASRTKDAIEGANDWMPVEGGVLKLHVHCRFYGVEERRDALTSEKPPRTLLRRWYSYLASLTRALDR